MQKAIGLLATLLAIIALAAFSLLPTHPQKATAAVDADFQIFLKQFPQASLPYSMTKESMQAMLESLLLESQRKSRKPYTPAAHLDDPHRYIPRNDMELVSRMPTYREPVARLETASHYALIFAVSQGYARAFKTYNVAVFDKTGKYVTTNNLAGTGVQYLTSGTIDASLQLRAQTYRINWKKDVDEYGTIGNRITGLTPETAREADLTQPGKNPDERLPVPVKEESEGASIGAIFH